MAWRETLAAMRALGLEPLALAGVQVQERLEQVPLAGQHEAVANEVIAKLSPTGSICVFTSAAANVLVDVAGYLSTGGTYVAITPTRVADTRLDEEEPLPLGPGETFQFAGVPPGTYTLRVRSTNGAGTSGSSNAVTLSFPGACSGVPAPR